MEDHLLGCTFVVQDAQQVGVGLAVVDHQRLAEPFREIDVPAEALFLFGRLGAPVELPRPIEVEAGLPHRDAARVGGEFLDLGTGGVVEAVRAGGMDGDGSVDAVVPMRGPHGETCRLEIVGDGDDASDPHRGGTIDDRGRRRGVLGAARVEVRVGVDEGAQRLRGFGGGTGCTHAL